MRCFLPVLSACLAACGDNLSGPLDADMDAPPFAVAPHASLPMVLGHSNTVLSHVQLVTLTYDNYALRDEVQAFGDAVVNSEWYSQVGADYDVIADSHATKVSLGIAPASLSRAEIEAQIQQVIATGAPGGGDLLYMLYVPSTVIRGTGLAGPDLRGYHEIVVQDHVNYAVVVVLDDGTGLATTTVTAAHFLIDAATNPYDKPDDGFYADPPKTDPWTLASGEVAELCQGEAPIALDNQPKFAVPRVYSNTAARRGDPPCIPSAPDDTWSDVFAEPSQIQSVPRGESVTFELTGWSTQAVPDWTLRTQRTTASKLTESEMAPELSSPVINNNRTVRLTLHAPPSAQIGDTGAVYVLSGPSGHPWTVGFVVE